MFNNYYLTSKNIFHVFLLYLKKCIQRTCIIFFRKQLHNTQNENISLNLQVK